MARIKISSILRLSLLLPAALTLPLDTYDDLPAPYNLPGLPDDLPVKFAYQSSSPSGFLPTGTVGAIPTPTATFITATGTGGGVSTGTSIGFSRPTGLRLDKREVESLALQKRRAFEGPRHHRHLHYYPYPMPSYEDPMPTAAATAERTGTFSSGSLPTTTPTASGTKYPGELPRLHSLAPTVTILPGPTDLAAP